MNTPHYFSAKDAGLYAPALLGRQRTREICANVLERVFGDPWHDYGELAQEIAAALRRPDWTEFPWECEACEILNDATDADAYRWEWRNEGFGLFMVRYEEPGCLCHRGQLWCKAGHVAEERGRQ